MNTISKILIIFSVILSVAACSTSPKVQTVQLNDNSLSKQALLQELAKLDETELKVKNNKGFNATNVASVIFWWPGIAYTYIDANEAERLIEQRRSHLTNLYNQKYGNLPSSRANA